MVENCLLNNNNILCSNSSSAKFNIKRRHKRDWRDIYLTGCVFTICCFPFSVWESKGEREREIEREKHCKFTYNNAHTLIWHSKRTRLNSQLFVSSLFDFAFLFLFDLSFIFIYEISSFSIYPMMGFSFNFLQFLSIKMIKLFFALFSWKKTTV